MCVSICQFVPKRLQCIQAADTLRNYMIVASFPAAAIKLVCIKESCPHLVEF